MGDLICRGRGVRDIHHFLPQQKVRIRYSFPLLVHLVPVLTPARALVTLSEYLPQYLQVTSATACRGIAA